MVKLLLVTVLSCLVAAITAAPRIYRGHKGAAGKHPYIVAIKINGDFHCGGSILNKYWILTAAHCVKGHSHYDVNAFSVMTGSNSLDSKSTEQHYKVKYFVGHDDYNEKMRMADDIGLIRVDREIEFNDQVRPVTLPRIDDIADNKKAVFSGWGLNELSNVPNELQEITLKIFNIDECRDIWVSPPAEVNDNQICTLNKFGEGVCLGDSGGPLMLDGVQIGIASYVAKCALGFPDVFTKVHSYLDWIQEQMNKYEKSQTA